MSEIDDERKLYEVYAMVESLGERRFARGERAEGREAAEGGVKERPILMSAPMVRALLAGTKTQTRRIMKPQPVGMLEFSNFRNSPWERGLRLWVRESFIHVPADYCWEASVSIPSRPSHTTYRADCDGDTRGAGWKPSIHMPRNLSRIDLEITSVRVERLQDISESDAIDEGSFSWAGEQDTPVRDLLEARLVYRHLWESINGQGSWDANPWVWVVTFRKVV